MAPGARELFDQLGRPLRDLRVSVTDRCNFRCTYCMPREKVDPKGFLSRAEIISFEEISRLCRIFVSIGVKKIRITGGEPLLRRELSRLVEMLSELSVELALTTNGVLLPDHARDLRKAGLDRITVSLDALDRAVFDTICDAPGFGPEDVLRGIEAAEAAGFSSIKINCAVRRGQNEGEVPKIARYFQGTPHVVRFIEFMDVGTRNDWAKRDVVPADEIRALLADVDDLVPERPNYRGEVAKRYRYERSPGEVGIIASVTEPFCGDCVRARLSADGHLYACLFASEGMDVKGSLRSSMTDADLSQSIASWWTNRSDRYSEMRATKEESGRAARRLPLAPPKVEMSFIGG